MTYAVYDKTFKGENFRGFHGFLLTMKYFITYNFPASYLEHQNRQSWVNHESFPSNVFVVYNILAIKIIKDD